MKKNILSIAVVLIALFCFNTAFAQSGHFVGSVCYNSQSKTISGKVAGLGNGSAGYSVSISGEYGCQNPGGNQPPSWQGFSLSNIPLVADGSTPGQYTFSVRVSNFKCHGNWTLLLNATAYLVYGYQSQDSEPVSTNCN